MNLNYDDFYKFLSSFTIVTTILSIYAAYHLVLSAYSPGVSEKQVQFFVIFFNYCLVFLAISVLLFIWAMIKWKKNQDKLDRKLSAETDLKIAQAEKAEKDLIKLDHGRLL